MQDLNKPWYEVWPERATPTNRIKPSNTPEAKKEILQYVSNITHNKELYIITAPKLMADKVQVSCKLCNHNWSTRAASIMSGVGCPRCTNHTKLTEEEFIRRLAEINANITITSFVNSKIPISCSCKICNNKWEGTYVNLLLNKRGCARCAGNKKKSHEEFIEELYKISPTLVAMSNYMGRRDPISIYCNTCKFTWETRPGDLLSGASCPSCVRHTQNYMYLFIEKSSGLYKIGITKNVIRRLSEVVSCDLVYYWDVGYKLSFQKEHEIHRIFENKRTSSTIARSGNTEFFKLTHSNIDFIIDHMKEYTKYDSI